MRTLSTHWMKVNLFKDVSRELEPIRNKIVRGRRLPFWTARITGIQNTFCKREVAGHWRRPHLNWSGQRSSITLQSMRTVLLYPNRSVLNGRLTRTGFQRKFPTQLLRTVRWKKLGLLRNTKIHHSTTCLKRGGGWHIISALCSDFHHRRHGNINILKLQIPVWI